MSLVIFDGSTVAADCGVWSSGHTGHTLKLFTHERYIVAGVGSVGYLQKFVRSFDWDEFDWTKTHCSAKDSDGDVLCDILVVDRQNECVYQSGEADEPFCMLPLQPIVLGEPTAVSVAYALLKGREDAVCALSETASEFTGRFSQPTAPPYLSTCIEDKNALLVDSSGDNDLLWIQRAHEQITGHPICLLDYMPDTERA